MQRQLDVGVSVFTRLLESDRRLLAQAAQAVAADYGFREAVAAQRYRHHELGARECRRARGRSAWSCSPPWTATCSPRPVRMWHGRQCLSHYGRAAEFACWSTAARSIKWSRCPCAVPLPVAWISMGFALDDKAARELADITGLGVTLSLRSGARTEVASTVPARHAPAIRTLVARRIALSNRGGYRGRGHLVALAQRGARAVRASYRPIVLDRRREPRLHSAGPRSPSRATSPGRCAI